MKDDQDKYSRLFLSSALLKWRMMVTIIKLKLGQDDPNKKVEDVIEQLLSN